MTMKREKLADVLEALERQFATTREVLTTLESSPDIDRAIELTLDSARMVLASCRLAPFASSKVTDARRKKAKPMKLQFTNESTVVHPGDFASAVAAFAAQLADDYCPRWDMAVPVVEHSMPSIDPDAFVLHVLDTSDQADALGYHDKDAQGKPVGFIFAKTSMDDGENWTVTLSHEGLELVGDRYCATWAQAGDGKMRAFEMCDAVEGDHYLKTVGGVAVSMSNFLLPAYFSDRPIVGAATDFLGKLAGQPMPAMTKGGYDIVINTQGDPTQEFAQVKSMFAAMSAGRRQRKESRFSRSTRRLHQVARMLGVDPTTGQVTP